MCSGGHCRADVPVTKDRRCLASSKKLSSERQPCPGGNGQRDPQIKGGPQSRLADSYCSHMCRRAAILDRCPRVTIPSVCTTALQFGWIVHLFPGPPAITVHQTLA